MLAMMVLLCIYSCCGYSGGISFQEVLRVDREYSRDDATIFVNLATFLDPLCILTMDQMMTKARHPRRIFFGIADQCGLWFPRCILRRFLADECQSSEFCATDNIRWRRIRAEDGWGPTFGRYIAALMYQGESYHMMIDSHCLFVPNWDVLSIRNALSLPTKGVLTHYPPGYDSEEQMVTLHVGLMVMCKAKYEPQGHLLMQADVIDPVNGFPALHAFTAGGFMFGDAQFALDVPFDPNLYFLFMGEEALYAARLWTAGWDMYTPYQALLYHNYNRHKAPRYWSISNLTHEKRKGFGLDRYLWLMQSRKANSTVLMVDDAKAKEQLVDISGFGMGHRRSLDEFYKFSNLNPTNWTFKTELCESVRRLWSPERIRKEKFRSPK